MIFTHNGIRYIVFDDMLCREVSDDDALPFHWWVNVRHLD